MYLDLLPISSRPTFSSSQYVCLAPLERIVNGGLSTRGYPHYGGRWRLVLEHGNVRACRRRPPMKTFAERYSPFGRLMSLMPTWSACCSPFYVSGSLCEVVEYNLFRAGMLGITPGSRLKHRLKARLTLKRSLRTPGCVPFITEYLRAVPMVTRLSSS